MITRPQPLLPPRFTAVRAIGDGAYGTVFAARDEHLGPVAVKLLKRASGESLRRFKNEFRTLSALAHPNLIVQHELIADGDEWLLVMELIEGDDFVTWATGVAAGPTRTIDTGQPEAGDHPRSTPVVATGAPRHCHAPAQVTRLLAATAGLVDGLGALHAAGRLHCDVKPSNVLVERTTGRVVLLDFGLVSALAMSPGPPGRAAGTPGYMSPEQAAGARLDEASDWHAVGVMLDECLGRDGPAELVALAAALRAPVPTSRPRGHEVAGRIAALRGAVAIDATTPAPARPPRPPLIGREPELARFADALAAADQGPVLMRVLGAAGHGKSALLDRFAEAARAAGALVLAARSYQHAQVPYKALDELVDELAAAISRERPSIAGDDLATLAQVFPVLGRGPTEPAREAVAGPELRRRVIRSFPRLLGQVAGPRLVVLILDDLHWGDDDSLPFLIEVLRTQLPAVVVAAARDDDPASRRLPAALADAAARTIDLELGPLTGAATTALIRAAAPDIGPQAARDAAAESGGMPLFAIELARHAAAHGGPLLSLDEVLRRRVAELPAAARTALALIAVSGAPVAHSLIGEAGRNLAVPAPELATAIRALVASRLVLARSSRGGDELGVYHDRIRDRVVDDLGPAARVRAHHALATALAARPAPDAERLAFHLRGAGRAAEAVPHLITAAERAAAALALERAAALYGEALAIGGPDGDDVAAARHARRADLLAAAGHPLASAEGYLAAAAASGAPGRRELRRRASEQLLRGGHFDRGLAIAEELAAGAGLRLPSTPVAALPGLVVSRLRLARWHRRWRGGDAIAARATIADDDRFAIDVAWTLASGLALIDPLRAAHFHGQAALRSLAGGDAVRVARSLVGEVTYSGMRGTASSARTRTIVDAARRVAAASGDPYVAALTTAAAGVAAVQEGRVRAGEAACREAMSHFPDGTGGAWERGLLTHFRTWALTYLGEIDELRRFVVDTLADAEARGDLHLATDQRTACANLVWLLDGGAAAARRQVERAMAAWSRGGYHAQHYYAMQALVHIALWEGDGRRALAIVDHGWPALRRSLLLVVQGVRIDALWLRARARLAAADAARGRARRTLLDSAQLDATRLERTDAPWARGLAAVVRARAADVAGSPAGELWRRAGQRCAAADLRGHPAIQNLWPVPL